MPDSKSLPDFKELISQGASQLKGSPSDFSGSGSGKSDFALMDVAVNATWIANWMGRFKAAAMLACAAVAVSAFATGGNYDMASKLLRASLVLYAAELMPAFISWAICNIFDTPREKPFIPLAVRLPLPIKEVRLPCHEP